ncbi:MAG: hypothetical protein ACI36Y_09390 [Coriobacteriales bacterium]
MPFGDWNGDGEVSAGEAMGTGAAIGGLLGDDGGAGGGPEGGGGGVGCGEVCSSCFALAVGYLLIVGVIAKLLTCAFVG